MGLHAQTTLHGLRGFARMHWINIDGIAVKRKPLANTKRGGQKGGGGGAKQYHYKLVNKR